MTSYFGEILTSLSLSVLFQVCWYIYFLTVIVFNSESCYTLQIIKKLKVVFLLVWESISLKISLWILIEVKATNTLHIMYTCKLRYGQLHVKYKYFLGANKEMNEFFILMLIQKCWTETKWITQSRNLLCLREVTLETNQPR